MNSALKELKGNKGSMNACVRFAAKGCQLHALDVIAPVFSRDGCRTGLEELLKMGALPAGSSMTQSNTDLKTLPRNAPLDAVYTSADGVRELSIMRNGLVED